MSSNSRPVIDAYPFSKSEGDNVPNVQQQTHDVDAQTGLSQLKAELDSIPDSVKTSFVHAQHVAPDLVSDKHLSQFLYAEDFNVKVSEIVKTFPFVPIIAS
jgi:hypothetical protein